MSTPSDTILEFCDFQGPRQGFTSLSVDRDNVDNNRVVRELLQNALDATPVDGAPCTVEFHLCSMRIKDIPHIQEYRQAFDSARNLLEHDEPQRGKNAIRRIEQALEQERVDCLICVDYGEGITGPSLVSLYSSGRSTKSSTGRGSVGHGHLTAFAPSALRYVLYVGRDTLGHETFGGHAVLATHHKQMAEGIKQYHPDGFIRNKKDLTQGQLFDSERGGQRIPNLLADWLPANKQGAAVVIVGYEPRTSQDESLSKSVLSAAAHDFMVAVIDGSLRLSFHDQRPSSSTLSTNNYSLAEANVRNIVEQIANKSRKTNAQRTYRTLSGGTQVLDEQVCEAIGTGVRVWIRKVIDEDEKERKRVSIFRDGMWIVDNPDEFLAPRHIPDVRPFDVVVDLSSEHEFGNLVRKSEGASHNSISSKELADKSERKKLTQLMSSLRQLIHSLAVSLTASGEEYRPPELRLNLTGQAPLPKRRPKLAAGDELAGGTAVGEDTGNFGEQRGRAESADDQGRGGPGNTDEGPHGGPKHGTVRAGNTSGISTSCRPDPQKLGRYHVSWTVRGGGGRRRHAKGLRIVLPSGTDQTSEKQIRHAYLSIADASGDGVSSNDGLEVHVVSNKDSGTVIIDLADINSVSALDRGLVRAEVVNRKAESE